MPSFSLPSGRATHFVTGDKRLLAGIRASDLEQPIPVTPREMLELLLRIQAP
jgi:hypothetical protein